MNTQYWEEEIETMSREKLQELQLQRRNGRLGMDVQRVARRYEHGRHDDGFPHVIHDGDVPCL